AGCLPILLLAGRTESYRRHCVRILGGLGKTTDPRTAYLVARLCTLTQDAGTDPSALVSIAERAVKQPQPHHQHTSRLACYRAGQHDRAIEQLRLSIAGNWRASAANWLVLAMAHQRLGQTDEARKWFDRAVNWMENTPGEGSRKTGDALPSLHLHDALA